MKRLSKAPGFRASSGNVFADLRVPGAGQETLKAELVRSICSLVEGKELRQVDLAARLGIAQPRVSQLLNGRTEGFSTEQLIRLLNRLGQRIDIVVRPAPRGRLVGDTYVDSRSAMLLEHPAPRYGAAAVARPSSGRRKVAAKKK
jgi:predicted XRE-type DNA-binding protein